MAYFITQRELEDVDLSPNSNKNGGSEMKSQSIFTMLALVLGLTFFVSIGIAAHTPLHAPMGEMKADAAAKAAFETGKALPDHTYYYVGGSIIEPDSVIALKKGYTLRDSKVWSKVLDMEDSVIRTWIQAWKNDGHSLSELNGGVILDADGKQAGIWYSHFPGGAVMMPIPGVLDIFTPQPPLGQRKGQGA
jgi:hypothetical protein